MGPGVKICGKTTPGHPQKLAKWREKVDFGTFPDLNSRTLLEGDLGPRTCQNQLSRTVLSISGVLQSDYAADYHPGPQCEPPTTSGEVSRSSRTNSDLSTLIQVRKRARLGFPRRFVNFW